MHINNIGCLRNFKKIIPRNNETNPSVLSLTWYSLSSMKPIGCFYFLFGSLNPEPAGYMDESYDCS